MAHNIDMTNDRANIAFLGSRNDVWHRLGQEMQPGMDIPAWAKAAGWLGRLAPSTGDDDMTRTTRTEMRGPSAYFTFSDTDHTPSWKRYGKGAARLEVSSHTGNPYLPFHVQESNLEGAGRSKLVMVTMDADQGRALYAW